MAVGVGIALVPHRDRHHLQCRLELLQVFRLAHAEPLLQHLGAIKPGHAHRHREASLIEHHGPLDAAADVQLLLLERSVLLLDLDRLGFALERHPLAVVLVLAVLHGQLVEIHCVDGVYSSAPARGPVETYHGSGKADLRRAIKVIAGPDQLHLHVPVERVTPGQVRIDDQHRLPAGRMCRPDGPGVGFTGEFLLLLGGRVTHIGVAQGRIHFGAHACHGSHVHVVDRAQ